MIWIYLIFCVIAANCGIKEAIMYSGKTTNPFGFNEHKLWLFERFCIFLLMLVSINVGTKFNMDYHIFNKIFDIGLYCFLSFPFFHLGAYYQTRNILGYKKYNFFTNRSVSGRARFEISFIARAICFVLSIILMII